MAYLKNRFCSILAKAEGEPIDGTAPENDGVILLPMEKKNWHRRSAKSELALVPNGSDLNQATLLFQNPLVLFYAPEIFSRKLIYVVDSTGISSFLTLGLRIKSNLRRIYAICTDGKKDACCAKFGMPIANIFRTELKMDNFSVALECSHIGGCRFAATAICFPSGNAYGRIQPDLVKDIIRAEVKGSIDTRTYRGNLFVSEIHCWIIRHCVEKFGFLPSENKTSVFLIDNYFRVIVSRDNEPDIEFLLDRQKLEFKLFSGCSNIELNRMIVRSTYSFIETIESNNDNT